MATTAKRKRPTQTVPSQKQKRQRTKGSGPAGGVSSLDCSVLPQIQERDSKNKESTSATAVAPSARLLTSKSLPLSFLADTDARSADSHYANSIGIYVQLFVDKYHPRTADQVVGHNEAKRQIDQWLQGRKNDPLVGFQMLLISGPCGSGKTALARAMLETHGYAVIESNSSDTADGEAAGSKGTKRPKKRSGGSGGAGVDVDTIYYHAKHLTNLKHQRVALLLDDIDGWSNLAFAKLKQLLVLHKKSVMNRVAKYRQQLADERKERLAVAAAARADADAKAEASSAVTASVDDAAPAASGSTSGSGKGKAKPKAKAKVKTKAEAKTKAKPVKRTRKKKPATLDLGLPAAYPCPMLCPIICTTSCNPIAHKSVKKLLDACAHAKLSAVSSSDMHAVLQRVLLSEQLEELSSPVRDDFVRIANGDLRKLLTFLNFVSRRAVADGQSMGDGRSSSSYDCFPDIWKVARTLFERRAHTKIDEVLFSCSYLEMLPEFVAENYLGGLRTSEESASAARLLSDCDLMRGARDGLSCAAAPEELHDTLSCWGIVSRLSVTNVNVRFPAVLSTYGPAATKRRLRSQLSLSAKANFARLSFVEQLELAELLMARTGEGWLERERDLQKGRTGRSKKQAQLTDDGFKMARAQPLAEMPPSMSDYGFDTLVQVEQLEKFCFADKATKAARAATAAKAKASAKTTAIKKAT